MTVSPIPDGYHTVSPYLIAEDAGQLLEFMQKAFGAKETFRMEMPDGSVGHAEVRIGDSVVMVGGAGGAWPAVRAAIHLYVPDVDATYQAALAAGARSTEEPADQFYGDRRANVVDAAGNQWFIATHVEDVPPEELEQRAAARS
jgi:PhnB protein